MRTSSRAVAPRKNGLSAGAMGVGLAGAVAGAAMGVAFTDEKTRRKVYKLTQDAQSSLVRLMEALEFTEGDWSEKVQMLTDRKNMSAKSAPKKAKLARKLK